MDAALEAGAREIIAARRMNRALDGLPEPCSPRTLADGYAMQRAMVESWDDAVAGWKVGATAKSVQELFGVCEPIYGPVFSETVFDSPARLRATDFQHLMLEAEFVFVFGESLPPRPARYRREEVADVLAALVPSMEIVSPRFRRLPVDKIPQLIADFGGNGGAVMGRPCADWRRIDLASHTVRLVIDGSERQRGTGAVVLGHPLNAVEWLANALRSAGLGIRKGQFVMTGTMTGIHTVAPNQGAVADFADLGQVEVVFA